MKVKDAAITKSQVDNMLEVLVRDKILTSKSVNKQMLYWKAPQGNVLSRDDMKQLDEQIAKLQAQANGIAEQKANALAQIQKYKSTPKTSELDQMISDAEQEKKELADRVAELKSNTANVPAASFESAEKAYTKARDQWRRRKRLYNDIRDTISEYIGNAEYQKIAEDMGVEQDPVPINEDKTSKLKAGIPIAPSKAQGGPPPTKKIMTKANAPR